ncbi:unnamed protein product [Phaeothamnion confervicola]
MPSLSPPATRHLKRLEKAIAGSHGTSDNSPFFSCVENVDVFRVPPGEEPPLNDGRIPWDKLSSSDFSTQEARCLARRCDGWLLQHASSDAFLQSSLMHLPAGSARTLRGIHLLLKEHAYAAKALTAAVASQSAVAAAKATAAKERRDAELFTATCLAFTVLERVLYAIFAARSYTAAPSVARDSGAQPSNAAPAAAVTVAATAGATATAAAGRPPILRDIIASTAVRRALCPPCLALLRLLLLPSGLNLRNVLWHGFLAPHELPRPWASLVVMVALDLAPFTGAPTAAAAAALGEPVDVANDLQRGVGRFLPALSPALPAGPPQNVSSPPPLATAAVSMREWVWDARSLDGAIRAGAELRRPLAALLSPRLRPAVEAVARRSVFCLPGREGLVAAMLRDAAGVCCVADGGSGGIDGDGSGGDAYGSAVDDADSGRSGGAPARAAVPALVLLEHGLRAMFSAVNASPEHLMAKADQYYSTLDGYGQRGRHQLLLGPVLGIRGGGGGAGDIEGSKEMSKDRGNKGCMGGGTGAENEGGSDCRDGAGRKSTAGARSGGEWQYERSYQSGNRAGEGRGDRVPTASSSAAAAAAAAAAITAATITTTTMASVAAAGATSADAVAEGDGEPNRLQEALPRGVLAALLDLFMLDDGPGLRAKIAHGELDMALFYPDSGSDASGGDDGITGGPGNGGNNSGNGGRSDNAGSDNAGSDGGGGGGHVGGGGDGGGGGGRCGAEAKGDGDRRRNDAGAKGAGTASWSLDGTADVYCVLFGLLLVLLYRYAPPASPASDAASAAPAAATSSAAFSAAAAPAAVAPAAAAPATAAPAVAALTGAASAVAARLTTAAKTAAVSEASATTLPATTASLEELARPHFEALAALLDGYESRFHPHVLLETDLRAALRSLHCLRGVILSRQMRYRLTGGGKDSLGDSNGGCSSFNGSSVVDGGVGGCGLDGGSGDGSCPGKEGGKNAAGIDSKALTTVTVELLSVATSPGNHSSGGDELSALTVFRVTDSVSRLPLPPAGLPGERLLAAVVRQTAVLRARTTRSLSSAFLRVMHHPSCVDSSVEGGKAAACGLRCLLAEEAPPKELIGATFEPISASWDNSWIGGAGGDGAGTGIHLPGPAKDARCPPLAQLGCVRSLCQLVATTAAATVGRVVSLEERLTAGTATTAQRRAYVSTLRAAPGVLLVLCLAAGAVETFAMELLPGMPEDPALPPQPQQRRRNEPAPAPASATALTFVRRLHNAVGTFSLCAAGGGGGSGLRCDGAVGEGAGNGSSRMGGVGGGTAGKDRKSFEKAFDDMAIFLLTNAGKQGFITTAATHQR